MLAKAKAYGLTLMIMNGLPYSSNTKDMAASYSAQERLFQYPRSLQSLTAVSRRDDLVRSRFCSCGTRLPEGGSDKLGCSLMLSGASNSLTDDRMTE